MGAFAFAKRHAIKQAFDAGSGDMQGNVEPVVICSRRSGNDVATCEVLEAGDTLDVTYRLLDTALDDEDFARIFHIAYLDVLTSHYFYNKTHGHFADVHLKLSNSDSGVVTESQYPDPE